MTYNLEKHYLQKICDFVQINKTNVEIDDAVFLFFFLVFHFFLVFKIFCVKATKTIKATLYLVKLKIF